MNSAADQSAAGVGHAYSILFVAFQLDWKAEGFGTEREDKP